jgi:colanic acid/amylovoran biosynthesis protein
VTKRLIIGGASVRSTNLGVRALLSSLLDGLAARTEFTFTILEYQHHAHVHEELAAGRAIRGEVRGAVLSKRPQSPANLLVAAMAARVGPNLHPLSRAMAAGDAYLDITGGDSFTDLYGARRFRGGALRKTLALRVGTPLVLLPQTYGPFENARAKEIAEGLCRGAHAAWARDERSFATLQGLLGDGFDPDRHRCGVDLAFGLARLETQLPEELESFFDTEEPIAGFNVSGLIWNEPAKAREQYRLTIDYKRAVLETLDRLIADGARVLLVPHVVPARKDSCESDTRACCEAVERLPAELRKRVRVAPEFTDPRHAKWLISRCDWFCGTRMHSTIAGLSSRTPTSTLAYSGKAQGVFETCGQGEWVADMRALETDAAIERVAESWRERESIARSLDAHMSKLLERVNSQMDEIAAAAVGESAEAFAAARRAASREESAA